MTTFSRRIDRYGRVTAMTVTNWDCYRNPRKMKKFADQRHAVITVTSAYGRAFKYYSYVQEQRDLNSVRTGFNLVDEERTRHILEGKPLVGSVRCKFQNDDQPLSVVCGWEGGHANPDAVKFGKTQIPDFWTNDRFMYEVSDVLTDAKTRWSPQVQDASVRSESSDSTRYVCVEERYGVPIRVVAEMTDDGFRCVTAFPDYSHGAPVIKTTNTKGPSTP